MTRSASWMSAAAALLACAIPAGCGVGGEGTGRYASGPVEGFGSVIVAGQRFDERSGRLTLEIDPRAPQERPLADLKLGMVVHLRADAQDRLEEAVVAPEVVGPVASLDTAGRGLIVAGQRIVVDAVAADPTLFEGVRNLAGLKLGDHLIVHGRRDEQGRVRATRVVRTASSAGVRVMGTAEQLDGASAVVGGLRVDLRGAVTLESPHVGDRVVVFGDRLAADGSLPAQVWGREAARTGEASSASLAGVVTRLTSAGSWQLQGVRVDATALSAGELAGVVNGSVVRAVGTLEGNTLRAQSVTIQPDAQAPLFTIDARVSDLVDASRFSARGTAIDAANARFEGFSTSNLANGVPVRITGTVSGNALVAAQVRAVTPPPGVVFVQAGALTDWDTAQQRLHLFGLSPGFRLTAATVFVGGSAAGLTAGAILEVRGTQAGDEFTVQTLTFASAGAVIEIAGAAATVEVTGANGFLQVNEVDIVWDGATAFLGPTGTASDLAAGGIVRIKGVKSATDPGVLRAIEIDARPSQPGLFRLRGTVTDYLSVADLRLDGQRVDASAARFEPPELAVGLAGAYVDIEGTLENGVLRASKVSDP
jgi:hypothetical protein